MLPRSLTEEPAPFSTSEVDTVQLKAPAFEPGADIPQQFTCDGLNISPALSWTTPPEGTRSFALIMGRSRCARWNMAPLAALRSARQ
jgi:phosphatidylethanolamine-binding protein (PEBP) family uncharacterized protein